jgi:hypothetical protein
MDEAHEAGAAPAAVHSSISLSPSEFPNANTAAADEAVDARGLSRLVVDELDLALAQSTGMPSGRIWYFWSWSTSPPPARGMS